MRVLAINNDKLFFMMIFSISLLTATSLTSPAFAETPEGCTVNVVSNGITLSVPTKEKGLPTDFTVMTEATAPATGNVPIPCDLEVQSHRVLINTIEVCNSGPVNVGVPGGGFTGLFGGVLGACVTDLNTAGPGNTPIPGPWVVFAEWDGVVFNIDESNDTNNAGADNDSMTNVVVPDFTVTKTPDPVKTPIDPMAEVQTAPVSWTIEIENTSTGPGVLPLTNCVSVDDRSPAPLPNIPMLNPGQVVQFQYDDTVSETTKNTVTVTCQDQFGDDIERMAMGTVTIYKPKVTLEKTCDAKVGVGQQATCSVTISNDSPDQPKASLTNCLFTDEDVDPAIVDLNIGGIGDDPIVIPGLLTPVLNAENTPYKNTASVVCEDQELLTVEAMDMATVNLQSFAVNIEKNCDEKVVLPFSTTIHCEIDVDAPGTNTGPITNCNIVDPDQDQGPNIAGPFDLDPGEAWPKEFVNREVTNQDVIDMVVTNTATVTCSSQESVDNVFNSDDGTSDIFSVAATIDDICTPETQTAETPGSITWTITLCNTSPDGKSDLTFNGAGTIEKCDLDGVTNCEGPVAEPEKTVTNLPLPASDPFDANVSCEIIEITKDELGTGKYTDVWSGTADMQAGSIDLDGMDMCEVNVERFDVNIVKDCDPKAVLPFDDTIDCTIDVSAPGTNTDDLTDCRVEDPSFGGVVSNPTPFTLAPGEVLPTIDVSRDITPADVEAMSVKNTATVTCSSPGEVDDVSNSAMDTIDIFSVAATVSDVCTPPTQEVETTGSITWTITLCNTSPDGKSDLTFNGAGTIEKCDLDGVTNCEGPVDEPEKEVSNLPLPASDPFDANISCETIEITKNELVEGKYTDIWSGIASMQAGDILLDGMDMCSIENPQDFTGCTPGYWKNNLAKFPDSSNWAYWHHLKYATVFGISPVDLKTNYEDDSHDDDGPNHKGKGKSSVVSDATLAQAIGAQGGGDNALARHATAALNNAGSSVMYPMSPAEVIQMVQDAYNPGVPGVTVSSAHSTFAEFNEAVTEDGLHCGLNNSTPNPDPVTEPED